MAYTKRSQLHTEMRGQELTEERDGTFVLTIKRGETGGYDVSTELDAAALFADQLNNPEITIAIHVEGDQD